MTIRRWKAEQEAERLAAAKASTARGLRRKRGRVEAHAQERDRQSYREAMLGPSEAGQRLRGSRRSH